MQRPAALRDGSRVRGPVGVGFEKRSNRYDGAPAPWGFTGLNERTTTQGTADGRRNGEARFSGDIPDQDGAVGGLAVRRLGFRPAPHALVGVQLRRVGGEVFETKARVSGEESANEGAAVDVGAVEEDKDRAAEMTEQVAQEGHDVGGAEVLIQLTLEVEPTAPPPGA